MAPKQTDHEPEAASGERLTAGQAVYRPLLKSQLEEEHARKASFEQRGLAVISTSGVLVSLLFALAAVVTDKEAFVLPKGSAECLIVALVCFVAAAVSALICNWPLTYKQVSVTDLSKYSDDPYWDGPADNAARRLFEAQVAMLERARSLNGFKNRILIAAMVAEILAIGALATAVALFVL